ncbi:hypothetical protein BP6252_12091 [Coleophoma cylindrospora]|uniref:Uncharacterized protein n=1 Tax=Coleophoma cylindrospora TaxID=1849047 RepID=A0A3D8QG89_9HELO|nr:hypothetical protein BP6252_12091 [Coleophoma cylindrospora]
MDPTSSSFVHQIEHQIIDEKYSSKPKGKLLDVLAKHLQPTLPKWLNPQASFGTHRCLEKGLNFWDITGPSLGQLTLLRREIQILLSDHSESLTQSLREPATVMFDLFMIGATKELACPTLAIISEKKGPRLQVITIIRERQVLQKYPGVLLGGCSRHPRYLKSNSPRSIATGHDSVEKSMLPLQTRVLFRESAGIPANGLQIYIPQPNSRILRKATVGGFLDLSSEAFSNMTVGITVAHAFEVIDEDIASDSLQESQNSGLEFCFDSEEPYFVNESARGLVPNTTANQGNKSSMALDLTQSAGKFERGIVSITNEDYLDLKELGVLYSISKTTENSNLDWAVIEITKQDLVLSYALTSNLGILFPDFDFSDKKEDLNIRREDHQVITRTGSGRTMTGIQCGSSTFLKMKHSRSFEEVWTVELQGSLETGDSGSWIIERDTAKVSGHVVAGDVDSGLAYVMPASLTFNDIQSQLKCTAKLTRKDKINAEPRAPTTIAIANPNSHMPTIMDTGPPWSSRTKTNEYFIPGNGIDWDVISSDITRYLGNDASVRPGTSVDPRTFQEQHGYIITAYRNLTTAMITDIKADSERWDAERRQPTPVGGASKGISVRDSGGVRKSSRPIVEYQVSTTHQSRLYYGPTPDAYLQPSSSQVYDYVPQHHSPGYGQPQQYATPTMGYAPAAGYSGSAGYAQTRIPNIPAQPENYYIVGAGLEVDRRSVEPLPPRNPPPTTGQYPSSTSTYQQQPETHTTYYSQSVQEAPLYQTPAGEPPDPFYGRRPVYRGEKSPNF